MHILENSLNRDCWNPSLFNKISFAYQQVEYIQMFSGFYLVLKYITDWTQEFFITIHAFSLIYIIVFSGFILWGKHFVYAISVEINSNFYYFFNGRLWGSTTAVESIRQPIKIKQLSLK